MEIIIPPRILSRKKIKIYEFFVFFGGNYLAKCVCVGGGGCKPDLKIVNKLKPKLLDGLKIMNNKQFSIEVDKLYNGKTFDFQMLLDYQI